MTGRPLVLAAHGSRDPRFAAVVDAIAARVRTLLPDVDVRAAYLENAQPLVRTVAKPGAVVVPLLLSAGYHVLSDLPTQVTRASVTPPVGPDRRLAAALHDRLLEAGWGGDPVTLTAVGSTEPGAIDDVRQTAEWLALRLAVPVDVAFVSTGSPRLEELEPAAIASYLLAPGFFHDEVRRAAAGNVVVSAPIGDHPVVAEIVVERYRSAAG